MVRRRPRYQLSRRQFVENSLLGAFLATSHSRLSHADSYSPYQGKCVVSLTLNGGADPTQFCDPKTNTPGEKRINNWAERDQARQAGNITFAPVADNQWLFEQFGSEMLVINGVDYGTNSHSTGIMFSKTGSNTEGKPAVTALLAAERAADQPLAYSIFAGVARTGGLISYNQFSSLSKLRALARPYQQDSLYIEGVDTSRFKRSRDELDTISTLGDVEAEWRKTSTSSVREWLSWQKYQTSSNLAERLAPLGSLLPADGDIMPSEEFRAGGDKVYSSLKQQMQSALLVFKSGLGSAADIELGSFDTHDNHDAQHEVLYTHLADALGFFWDYAEELGIADRILLVIGSDFGRTNFYNDGEGKDHWPVGSYIIMERNAPWGNRVVGLTDELHFAKRINPSTLREDRNGILITPAHVHKALQEYLGLDLFAEDMGLALRGVESLPLFDSSLQSVGGLSPYARGIW